MSRVATLAALCSAPIALTFLLFPQLFLSVFGEEYLSGARALQILALGQLVNALTGPVNESMVAMGLQKRFLAIHAGVAVMLVLAFLLLIPMLGMEGAAIASSLAAMTLNLTMAWQVHRRSGLVTFVRPSAVGPALRDAIQMAAGVCRKLQGGGGRA